MDLPCAWRELAWCAAPTVLALIVLSDLGPARAGEPEALPPVRAITRGPKFHWFGYYDKLEFDPAGRYVLGMEVGFEHRSPRPDDVIKVGMVDLEDNDRWIELGESRAWGWQQGCMLQWGPGSRTKVLWNDREGDRFVCRVLDVETRAKRTIPCAVYTLSPDGRTAVAPDFARIQDMRPGYGYAGLVDKHRGDMAPADSGIFRIDLATGERELIISLADIARFGDPHPSMKGAKHYFNHLLFNTDGSRFVFLHRWRPGGGRGGFQTRMLTANVSGNDKDIRVVDPSGKTSHFIWRDPDHVLAWTRPRGKGWGFFLFEDRTGRFEQIGARVMPQNGHCTYLPGSEWILNDTYPDRRTREQRVYLYHVPTKRKVPLGAFRLPGEYRGEWRCDTHPRASPDGRKVVIDSAHGVGEHKGRQLYLIDISAIVGQPGGK